MKSHITQSIEIQHGRPVLAGRRLPVDVVLGSLAAGMTYEDVQKEYGVKLGEILACLAFASSVLSTETQYPLPDVI